MLCAQATAECGLRNARFDKGSVDIQHASNTKIVQNRRLRPLYRADDIRRKHERMLAMVETAVETAVEATFLDFFGDAATNPNASVTMY